jgi:putative integral membrane protein (TIGR02587 family)
MNFSHHRTIAQSAREYIRGIAGALVFSLPLLFTMEIWQAAAALHPGRLLLYVVVTFGLLLLYNRYAGLREDAGWGEVAIDSVEEMGLGLMVAAAVLWLTGRIHGGLRLPELTAKIVMEGMTVAIGVSVGTAQLGGEADGDEGLCGDDGPEEHDYLEQAALGLCGAMLFAANIAPTDEVSIIAAECHPAALLILAAVSLVCCALVLHFSEMHGTDRFVARESPLHKWRGVVTTYAVALVASAGCLYLFGRLDDQPWTQVLAMTVVVGLPAALGASAGRLLLQSGSNFNNKPKP